MEESHPEGSTPESQLYPVLGIGAEGEGAFEHQEEHRHEDGEARPAVGEESVDALAEGVVAVVVAMLEGGSEGAADVAVAGLVDDVGGGALVGSLEEAALALDQCLQLRIVGLVAEERQGAGRTLEETDGEIALGAQRGAEERHDALDGMHDILAVVDMDVAEPFPTLGGADEPRKEVVDAGAVDWINDTREDTHLLLKTVDINGVSGGEEEVVFGECQHEATVHVDELGSEDETLVEVGAIDGLQHHIGLDGLDFLAVVEFYPLDFDPVGTTGDSLLQGTAEG